MFFVLAGEPGLEPGTNRLTVDCSTIELLSKAVILEYYCIYFGLSQ
jgi:hypothetical protein